MTTPTKSTKPSGDAELRKGIVYQLDLMALHIGQQKLYTPSAEMNAEILVIADEIMKLVEPIIANKVTEARIDEAKDFKQRLTQAVDTAAKAGKPNLRILTKMLQDMRPIVLLDRPDGEYAMYWDDETQLWSRARHKDLVEEAKRQLNQRQERREELCITCGHNDGAHATPINISVKPGKCFSCSCKAFDAQPPTTDSQASVELEAILKTYWNDDDPDSTEAVAAIQSLIATRVAEARIDELERICCCDVEPINNEPDERIVNVCQGDVEKRIAQLRKQGNDKHPS